MAGSVQTSVESYNKLGKDGRTRNVQLHAMEKKLVLKEGNAVLLLPWELENEGPDNVAREIELEVEKMESEYEPEATVTVAYVSGQRTLILVICTPSSYPSRLQDLRTTTNKYTRFDIFFRHSSLTFSL